MGRITNNSDISLELAVWLLHDEYDYIKEEKYISVTGLMKPIRQIIIPPRLPPEEYQEDVSDYIARALGHSLHGSIEKAWTVGYAHSLRKLGYPQNIIDLVRINPTDEERKSNPDIIPVFLEQREIREFNGFRIGGKFDMVTEGIVKDTKSTSVWNWVKGTRDEEHQIQGSLYRWLDAGRDMPRITEDHMRVNYIFTDWQGYMTKTNPNYPQKRVAHKDIPLLTLNQTEEWIRHKLNEIQKHYDTPEFMLPECTDEELWLSEPKFAYYSDPSKTDGRSTKNFPSLREANQHQSEKGKGIVITTPGTPKRCEQYCNAFNGCSQKDKYFS